ncbi:MAG TPA: M12 family metallo-peptidase, partial [Tahibacter sp.]|uniref:M12 family metallo-peptidase n=1 Tax=Tahibacter sp. TaxID=2056211 RepID=UPI002C4EC1B1
AGAPPPSGAQESAPDSLARTIAARKAAGNEFHEFTLLQIQATPLAKRADVAALVSDGTLLRVDEAAVKSLLARDPQQFTLPVPGHGDLELVRVNYDDLIVEGPGGDDLSWTNTARHYQGTLKEGGRSVAAVSVFRNLETGAYEISGVYGTTAEGNTLIGRIKGRNAANEHLVYRESAVRTKSAPAVECGMDAVQHRMLEPSQTCPVEPEAGKPLRPRAKSANEIAAAGDCVRIHLEVENDVYRTHGANTTNYATGFFNIAKSVYANESIPINLHYMKVWTTPSPEANIGYYYDIWNAFWNRKSREGIQGDLAILVGFHIDRGIASLNRICGPDYNQTGISPIRDYPAYPTYSWAGATLPHEIGHLFGSEHTQACSWNGNNTALDGCAAPEGSCPRPAGRYGTIMSYCSDFSLAQGFGTQPGNLIRSSFSNATCLACGGGCTSTIAPMSASVGAAAASGSIAVTTSASNCTWTAASTANWITVTSGGGPFAGNGSVSYTVAANTGAARSGTLTIAGQTFTVSQQAGAGGTPLTNGVA